MVLLHHLFAFLPSASNFYSSIFAAKYRVFHLISTISQASFLLLFIWQDLDGVILCIIASSGIVDSSVADNALHTIRSITKCNCKIVVSIVHEPNLEPNTILATIIVFG